MFRSHRPFLRRIVAVAFVLPLFVAPVNGAAAHDGWRFERESIGGTVETQGPWDRFCKRRPWVPFCHREVT